MSMRIMKTKLFQDKLLVVGKLSPEELKTELEDRNQDVGPLLGSTMKVYQRKLARLLAEEVQLGEKYVEEEVEEEDYSDSDFGDEDEEEEEDETDSHVQAGGDTGPYQRSSARKAAYPPTQPPVQPQTSKPSGLVPVWVQMLALLLLTFLIFAIWYSMEEAVSSTPKISTD